MKIFNRPESFVSSYFFSIRVFRVLSWQNLLFLGALRVSAVILFFLLPAALFPADVRILFSSSLNGNLDGCECAVIPVSGFVKRAKFLESYRAQYPSSILVDTGDFVVRQNSESFRAGVYRAFGLLGYDALVPGDQDLDPGVQAFAEISRGLPFLAANLRNRGGQSPWTASINKRVDGAQVSILGLVSPEAFTFSPRDLRAGLEFTSGPDAIRNMPPSDLLIVLSHGGADADRILAQSISRPVILIGGHDQTRFKEGPGIRLSASVNYFQSGRDGNEIGEIVARTKGQGQYEIISRRLISFGPESPDHPQIRAMIKQLQEENRR